jgi:dienelactone hydrolase
VALSDPSTGNALDPRVIPLIDKIVEPASWFTTFVYKPIYVLQAMIIAIPWKIKTRISVTKGPVFSFVQGLRTSPPPFPTDNLKIAAAGFCWGGKHTMLLAQDAPSSRVHRHESQINSTTLKPLIDCAFTAHPSYIDVPNDITTITIPISVAVGDADMAMKLSLVQEMKEILEVKKKGDHEVNIIPGAKHGFAVRTHPDDEHEMKCAEEAESQAIEWFTRWFS